MKERITYLFIQYYNNRSTRKELEEFFRIINNAKHDEEINSLIKNAYDEIKQNNPSLTYINEEGKLVLQEPDWLYETISDVPINEKSRRPVVWAIAASVFLLISIGITFWKFNSSSTSELIVVKKFTERTEHKYLLLSDSTQVWLNASTTIKYPENFNKKRREVYLTGEAYFDVKHADKIPFVIHTGDVTTVVLGTAFNIKAYKGQQNITVSVKRGKVRVIQKNKVISTLIKGQEVKIGKGIKHRKIIEKEGDANKIGAWQYGYLTYEDEYFADIMSDFQRIYNVEIKIENESLNRVVVTTSLDRTIGVQKALQVLCELTDSDLVVTDNQYIIR
ncbi:MAG TPA: FecR domain-containing protein [Sphingobacteriaceae bacterium]